MTNIIFAFSVSSSNLSTKNTPLSCVWTETGNPRQPLVCKWVARPQPPVLRAPVAMDSADACNLCA